MKKNINSGFYLATGILAIIVGIIFCITIFGIILGVPLIIGANKFFSWSKMSAEEIETERDSIFVWSIVIAILMFPIGLIALVPVFNFEGQLTAKTYNAAPKEESFDSKIDKIKKLHELKEQGVISEEDFKLAKEKILNK